MKKMCPYNRSREKQLYRQTNTYDDSGEINGYMYTMQVDFVPLPCVEEQCGAWRNGACHYAALNLENE